MYPYLKDETKIEEFKDIYEIASMLFSRRKSKHDLAENELLKLGIKSIRPLAYTIEVALRDHDMSDEEIDQHADNVTEIIIKIGKDALPYLDDFAIGSYNIFVNDWAQETIFKVMGLEGAEKQKVCHHFGLFGGIGNKDKLLCGSCGAKFDKTEYE
ncbi:MAG TPA: hypothetical protein C5S51_10850 [Methanosarcinaceae archaeon]|nr:hypothetical protein [Methanosarcinaceae archaeon]